MGKRIVPSFPPSSSRNFYRGVGLAEEGKFAFVYTHVEGLNTRKRRKEGTYALAQQCIRQRGEKQPCVFRGEGRKLPRHYPSQLQTPPGRAEKIMGMLKTEASSSHPPLQPIRQRLSHMLKVFLSLLSPKDIPRMPGCDKRRSHFTHFFHCNIRETC